MAPPCLGTDSVNLCRTCSKVVTNVYFDLYQEIPVEHGPKKTYYKLLNELLNLNTLIDKDVIKAKKLCKRCGTLLKSIYLFILEAQRLHEEYTMQAYETSVVKKIKLEDCLEEPSIDITQEPIDIAEIKMEDHSLKLADFCDNDLANNDNQIAVTDNIKQESVLSKDDSTIIVGRLVLDNVDEPSNSADEDKQHYTCNKNLCEETSDNDLAVRCDVCNKVYKNGKVLNKHKYYTHMSEEEKLRCNLCEFKTSRISCLKVHMSSLHGPETVKKYIKPKYKPIQKYPCNRCTKKYCRKDHLKRHIREKHNNVKSAPPKLKSQKPKDFHLCDFCGQSFTTINSLHRHSKTHTDERPFKCDLCGKSFRRHQDLTTHRVIHSDNKPHQCVKCGKSFKRPDKLRTHMIVHSELRPYKCKECTKTFKYASVLKTHMHIHTGQKPFECKTCNENFSLRTTLNAHCLKNGHIK